MPRRKNAAAAKKIVVDSENHGEVEVEAVAAVTTEPAVAAAEPPAATESAAVNSAAAAETSLPTLEIPAEQPATPISQQLAAAAEATPAANEQSTESAVEDRGLGGGPSRPTDEMGCPPEKTLLQRLYDWLMT